MKAYRLKDKDYKSEWELRSALKNISFPHITKENEAKVCEILGVEIVELPDPVYEPTEEELTDKVRRQRNRLIQATDFYLMPDYPSTEEGKKEVMAYRQALRDITEQEGFPREVKFPDMPSVLKGGQDA